MTNVGLVTLNASDFELQENKAEEIRAMFQPMLDKMVELEKEYHTIDTLKMSEETCQKAKELRLQYVKVRTGTAEIHKKMKAFYLNGGRFVDAWKNVQIKASADIEDKLKDIENFYVNLEAQKIAKIVEVRTKELQKYDVFVMPQGLGTMANEVYANFLAGAKVTFENKIQAEKKAAEEAKQREEAEQKEKERLKKENAQLKKEQEEQRHREEQTRKENEKLRREAAEAEQRKNKKEEEAIHEDFEAEQKNQKTQDMKNSPLTGYLFQEERRLRMLKFIKDNYPDIYAEAYNYAKNKMM